MIAIPRCGLVTDSAAAYGRKCLTRHNRLRVRLTVANGAGSVVTL
jgi:hypothetical protein